MIFDLKNLEVQILKQFDNNYNYFNPSHYRGKTICRRQSKMENKLLVSDIIDISTNRIILSHYIDDNYIWSYEDARLINQHEFGVCVCKLDKTDITKIVNVHYKKYNINSKTFIDYKTQNAHFEKHWQFINDNIIYHLNPYTLMDSNENIIFKKQLNWKPWIEKYGNPGLSTNVFEIFGKKYLLFHSYITTGELQYKYFIGLLLLNHDYEPIGYYYEPIFESNKEYTDQTLLHKLWEWRKTDLQDAVKYEVIFPMSVSVENQHINIYSGLNDCSCVNIKINKFEFIEKIKNELFILV